MFPSKRTPDDVEDLLEKKYKRTTAIKSNRCIKPPIGCGKPITKFRNNIASREYTISGLCQDCQDKIFLSAKLGKNYA